MDKFLTTSEARQKFFNIVEDVDGGDQVIITKHGVPKAAIISFEELQTLKALARLWQTPEALKSMRRALEDSKEGRRLKYTGTPNVEKILTAARKKGLLRG